MCHAVQVRIERAAELFDGALERDGGGDHVHFNHLQTVFASKGADGIDVVRSGAKLSSPFFAGQRCGRRRPGGMRVNKARQARIELPRSAGAIAQAPGSAPPGAHRRGCVRLQKSCARCRAGGAGPWAISM